MMKAIEFLNNLQKRTSDYKYAEQAIDYAAALKQLSEGIYTEEERFVYELLQNAVDAYIDTNNSKLIIKIAIIDNVLCFMHNGAPFSEKDIEGLCGVGRSNKASGSKLTNKKKVGYKGIGFKSVFMKSVDSVCVSSGDYCFKFDKHACVNVMPKYPNITLSEDDIPWQVIPIPCDMPSGFDISGFNVATYIKTATIKDLLPKIENLLRTPQFLLFLNAENISIDLYNNGNCVITAGRITTNGEVKLLSNNVIVSNWLVHTTPPIPVSDSVRMNLKNDFNTPDKLKTATDFEISYAIKINEHCEIEKVEDSVLYTFLPTSYKNLGVPFLINANFITDAGRQQLHQNSEWNHLIFKHIPGEFFKWISTISPKFYDYYKILPDKSPKSYDSLTKIYAEEFSKAIEQIPFIPRLCDRKVIKVSDAIIDKVGLSDILGASDFISYVNKKYNKTFLNSAFVQNIASSLLKSYGVFMFDKEKLSKMLIDMSDINISVDKDVKLINYLYNYCQNKDSYDAEFVDLLSKSKMIYDDNNQLAKAESLFFPTRQNVLDNDLGDVSFVNETVYESLSDSVLAWLGELGVKDLSRDSFVSYILSNPDYITVDNAVETGKFLFDSWGKENYLESSENLDRISVLPFLSKKGKLIPISNLYLSSEYHPEDDIESLYDQIDYISSEYVENGNFEDWAFFLKKCGIRHRVSIVETIVEESSNKWNQLVDKYEFFSSAAEAFKNKKHSYSGYWGYKNPIIRKKLILQYFSYVDPEELNYELYKYIFSKVLSLPYESSTIKDKIEGKVSYWGNIIKDELKQHLPTSFTCKYKNYLEYILSNEQKFPTQDGNLEYACDIFLNTPYINMYGGNYIPTLAIDTQVHVSWMKILPFKNELVLEDYLSILENVSLDPETDNKERISSIYQRLVELGYHNNALIQEWGKSHKILSTRNGRYCYPVKLSYINVSGFKNKDQVYIGRYDKSLREGLLKLLQTFGVKVITNENIKPEFINKQQSDDLRKLLINKLNFITLLKEDVKDKDSFSKERIAISAKINECAFYHCDRIDLSYGNDNDVITKSTFAVGNELYYTGSLKPTKIEPIIQPISKCLGLRNVCEELLIVLITDDKDELIDYLSEKGYSTECLPIIEEKSDVEDSSESIGTSDKTDESEKRSERSHVGDTNSKEAEHKNNEKYLNEYSEKVKEFMGTDFSMPSEKVKSEHIIVRYRILMYIKQHDNEYKIKSSFDEKEFIRKDGYAAIPLENGKQINAQGARFGIWYLSPTVWEDIINKGNYACLCVGNAEDDFMMVKDEDDIKKIAESTRNVLMKMTPTNSMDIMSTIKSVMNPHTIMLGDGIAIKEVFKDRDVHLMLMVHKTPEPVLNSIFDDVFKNQGSMTL